MDSDPVTQSVYQFVVGVYLESSKAEALKELVGDNDFHVEPCY